MLESSKDIHVFTTAKLAGSNAGIQVERHIEELQEKKESIRIVFAAAPSQDAMLEYLSKSERIRWDKIVAFNMDEYIGLPSKAPETFAHYLETHLFSKVKLKEKHTINAEASIEEEITRYSRLIQEAPIDIVCLGIGENGHIAFNDPPVADFNDPLILKEVNLDASCRMQQVNDGCFSSIDAVPQRALTLTIPALFSGERLFCVVVGEKKSQAVKDTFAGVNTWCPASILTTHKKCEFFFDTAAFKELAKVKTVYDD